MAKSSTKSTPLKGAATLSDLECELARRSYIEYLKYCWQDKTNKLIVGRPTLELANTIDYVIDRYRKGLSSYVIVNMPPRHGKFMPYDTQVLTTEGFKNHGDLKYGDYVFGDDGKPKMVLGNSGLYNWNVVNIKIDNNTIIKSSPEHLWKVYTSEEKDRKSIKGLRTKHLRQERVLETKNIFDGSIKHRRKPFIKCSPCLEMKEQSLEIQPYVLGAWLGDGAKTGGNYTCDDIEIINNIKSYGYTVTKQKSKYGYGILGLSKQLRAMGLIKNKHIPKKYLMSSKEQRIELLQGLMDTDGSCDIFGNCEFFQKESQLAKDVCFLIRSLGYKTSYKPIPMKINGIVVGKKVRLLFRPNREDIVFKLKRKSDKLINKNHGDSEIKKRIYIKEIINYNEVLLGNCITVEGGMYLAGEHLIPTHNSDGISRYLAPRILGEFNDVEVLTSSHSDSVLKEFSRFSRNLIDSEEYRRLYPKVVLDKGNRNTKEWSITIDGRATRGKAQYNGIMSGVASKGADVLIIDDVFRTRKDAESQLIRDNIWQEFTDGLLTRLAPVHIVFIVLTRWHKDDLVGRILERPEDFKIDRHIVLPAISEDYENGVLFPERFSLEYMNLKKKQLGEYGFNSLYQQQPMLKGGNRFKVDNLVAVDKEPDIFKQTPFFRTWDLASSLDGDYTVGAKGKILLKDKLLYIYLDDIKRLRELSPARDKIIKDLISTENAKVGIEAFGSYKDSFENIKKVLNLFHLTKLNPPGNKEIKAEPLEAIIEGFRFYYKKDSNWNKDFLSEMREFPSCKHDDIVDAISLIYWLYDKLNKSQNVYTNKAY